MAAAWQAMCERRITSGLAVVMPPRPDAIEEVARVGRHVQTSDPFRPFRNLLLERFGLSDDFAFVAGLDRAFVADETNRTGSQPRDVVRRAVSERRLQEIDDQLHAVGIPA